ncbi:MAG: AhpC/TSA family protein [Bacteroidales bacterium]|nr:AhpC/TSA family protein [Bacteroidales bacterium]
MVLFLLFSCNTNKTDTSLVIIKGKFENHKNKKILFEELDIRDIKPVDSTITDKNGNFHFKIELPETGFYILRISKNNFIPLLLEKGEIIEINSDATQIADDYVLKGSNGTQLLKEFELYTKNNEKKIDSLGRIFIDSKYEPDFLMIRNSLDSNYKVIFKEQQEFVKNFIERNINSLASLIVINKKLKRAIVLDKEDDFEYFEKLDKCLIKKYPDNKHALDHHIRVVELKRKRIEKELAEKKLATGTLAPDIVLNDTSNKPVALSSLNGKFVIIYFWAAWDAKCRQENPKIVKLYNKFKHKGLKIYGVSLDKHKKIWTGAIKLDKLDWIQVSDLKGINSPVVKLYNIPKDLPCFYLLNKEGKIITKSSDINSLNKHINEILMKM